LSLSIRTKIQDIIYEALDNHGKDEN